MQRINLDTSRKASNQDLKVFIRTGERAFTTIGVSITTYGIPFDLTGYTVNFEGANADGRFSGGSANIVNASNGQIEYTFTPTDAAVEGWFETAYFVIKQADVIEGTTEAFRVHVSRRVDIDDVQAAAGVNTLQETINSMEAAFGTWKTAREQDYASLQTQANNLDTQITTAKNDLDAKVTAAQTALGNTKNTIDADIATNKAALDAAKAEFDAADFYTKAETDTKLALKVDKSSYDGLYTTSKIAIPAMAGFEAYNSNASSANYPMAIRRFGVVTTKGAYRNLSQINLGSNDATFSMGQLPVGYRPAEDLNFIAQGTNMRKYLVTITKGGVISGSRYGADNVSDSVMPAGHWLNIGMTFVAAE